MLIAPFTTHRKIVYLISERLASGVLATIILTIVFVSLPAVIIVVGPSCVVATDHQPIAIYNKQGQVFEIVLSH